MNRHYLREQDFEPDPAALADIEPPLPPDVEPIEDPDASTRHRTIVGVLALALFVGVPIVMGFWYSIWRGLHFLYDQLASLF